MCMKDYYNDENHTEQPYTWRTDFKWFIILVVIIYAVFFSKPL